MIEEVKGIAQPCGVFLVNATRRLRVPAPGNSIRSSSLWRSSSVHFPREPNKQPICGRGENLELVFEAGSWQNKLHMSQRARKGATRSSVTAAQGLQQSWEENKAWHIPISMGLFLHLSPCKRQSRIRCEDWRHYFLERHINLSP